MDDTYIKKYFGLILMVNILFFFSMSILVLYVIYEVTLFEQRLKEYIIQKNLEIIHTIREIRNYSDDDDYDYNDESYSLTQ